MKSKSVMFVMSISMAEYLRYLELRQRIIAYREMLLVKFNQLKNSSCDTFAADMKVKVGANYFYPDVMVDCSELDGEALFTRNRQRLLLKYCLDQLERWMRR